MDGETDNCPSGEQAEEVALPGWYADPHGAPELRLWDGKRWTLESKPWSTPMVEAESSAEEAESSPAPFNWPALAATLVATGFVAFMLQPNCSWEDDGAFVYGACLARDFPAAHNAIDVFLFFATGPMLVVFGILGMRRRYARGWWASTVLAALGVGVLGLEYLYWVMFGSTI